jgi:hypothetical protein
METKKKIGKENEYEMGKRKLMKGKANGEK